MDLFPPVKPAILIADEKPNNIARFASMLERDCSIWSATDAEASLEIAQSELPDIILLSTGLSGSNGYEVCRRLKSNEQTRHIPVILVVNHGELDGADFGLDLGAVDCISHPVDAATLRFRVRSHVADLSSARTNRISNAYLEFEIEKRARQLHALQNVTVLALATLAETRDTDTGNHLRRTQNYVRSLAQCLATRPRFAEYLTVARISNICKCAPLHDIGKVGIPDRILHKPGRYTLEEFEVMKTHPVLGYDALVSAQEAVGNDLDFLDVAREIVLSHHERWDGGGYPDGLKGENIPIPARLMALADVYDALISPRVYKPGMPHQMAVQMILQGSGTQFDPEVVDVFLEVQEEFDEIAMGFADTEMQLQHKSDFMNLFVLKDS